MANALFIVDNAADFFAALDLMHPKASAQWDIDVATKVEIPEGRIAVHIHNPPGDVLGTLYVYGVAFSYGLVKDKGRDRDGEVIWRRNEGVIIREMRMTPAPSRVR